MAAKTKASTQDHLDIEDIIDDLIVFKTGWVALVLTTTAVNFDLLSETEQDSTIYSYSAFLNSLTFPIQIMIRSKKADISAYFTLLSEAEASQMNPDIKRQIQKYRDFLQSIIQQKTVLDKNFYLVVNYNPLEKGIKSTLGIGSASKSKSKLQLVADAKNSLMPKRDHITKQMTRLGLTARQLSTKELIELFYDIYNPAPTGTQRVILDSASYTVPIVEPAIEIPQAAPQASEQLIPNSTQQAFQPVPLPQTPNPASPAQNALQTEGLRPVPLKETATNQQATNFPNQQPTVNLQQEPPTGLNIPPPQQVQPVFQQEPIKPLPTQTAGTDAQLEALRKLQEVTAKAVQLVNSQVTTTNQAGPLPNISTK